MPLNILKRPRRNRKSSALRLLTQENNLTAHDLIAPYFLTPGKLIKGPITSLPGQFRLSLDQLLCELDSIVDLGIQALILFPVVPPTHKDMTGSYACSEENHLLEAVQHIKAKFPHLCILADVALDPFTSHGHDGLLSKKGDVLNDETVEKLALMSVLYAEAGVDVIAPSDMMDGRVRAIRETLDQKGYEHTSIMSYSAKYASSLYGPFREALKSSPALGHKKSYQMNPANIEEALLEAKLDEEEGADCLMIKPASLYLDVIAKIKQQTHLPIAAYHVSGEYAMLKAAAENKWLDFNEALLETLLSIKRAGANMIISYGAKEAALLLKS